MNCYILTEDEMSLRIALRSWLTYMNFLCTTEVANINEVTENSYILQSGQGISQLVDKVLYQTMETIIEGEQRGKHIDKLIVILDAEEISPSERLQEVNERIHNFKNIDDFHCEIKVIVCDCCFETWLLCNSSLYPTVSPDIANPFYKFYSYYNVSELDPEKMNKPDDPFPNTGDSKADFHFAYIHEMCKYNHKPYRKKKPGFIVEEDFFNQLVKRVSITSHGRSFKELYDYITNLK